MRKLDRALAAPPACLGAYAHGRNHWDDVSPADKQQIRDALQQMQGKRCAYCEGPLDELGQHIEHFRRRRDFVALTFAWANLFLSCDQNDSCGHFKDRGKPYNPDDLLDPCAEDPSEFLRFRSDGTIDVRDGLSERAKGRADLTLRVLNLHAKTGRLRNMRKAAAATYLKDISVEFLATLDPEDRRAYAQAEIEATASKPFSTVVRHLFEDCL